MIEHIVWLIVSIGCYYGGYYMGRERPFRVRFQDHHVEKAVRKLRGII